MLNESNERRSMKMLRNGIKKDLNRAANKNGISFRYQNLRTEL